MFCANCGSKLPDGSNFCSVCGAKIPGLEAPEPFENKRLEKDPAKTQAVSFDWSNVKDEPHKKSAPKVHSPWGTTELSNRDFFDSDDYAPNEEYSRTMSFIDLLKKERDERAQAAAENARQYTDKEETPYDYSAFEEAPSYYVPPLYEVEDDEDLIQDRTPRYGKHSKIEDDYEDEVENAKIEVEVEPEDDDTDDAFDIFDTTDIPKISDTDTFADTLDEIEIPEIHEEKALEVEPKLEQEPEQEQEPELKLEEKPEKLEDTLVLDPAEISDTMEIPELSEVPEVMEAFNAFETSEPTEELEDVPEYLDLTQPFEKEIAAMEEEKEPESLDNLDSEIADILAVGSGKVEDDKEINIFDDAEVEPEPIEETVAEPEPIEEPELELEPETISEPEIELEPELPLVDEVEEEPIIELLPEEDEEVIPAAESEAMDLNSFFEPEPIVEPAAEPVVELPEATPEEEIDEEAEMDDLKQRLTDLMGYSPSEEEVAEATEELLIQEITDEDESDEDEVIEIELGDEESDAIPVDEIERELFGETTDEDIEAEATKKIDKFYTLYKKNEEFQKLLDEEYNKLKTEDGVPHVDELLAEEPNVQVEKFEEETVAPSPIPEVKEEPKEEEPVKEEPKKEEPKKQEKPKKEKIKKEKPSKNKEVDDGVVFEGGNKLTIVAVILAALLVIVLAMIIIMYVAPYSGLAIKIDSIIQTFSSLFSSVGTGTYWLL